MLFLTLVFIFALLNVWVYSRCLCLIHWSDILYHVSGVTVSCICIKSIPAYCWVATFLAIKKKKLQRQSISCVHEKKTRKVTHTRGIGQDLGICIWHEWPCLQWNWMIYLYLHQCVTLTVPFVRLLLCQFLLCCDFRRCQAPAGIQLLWFVADDGTVLARQLAACNHSNRKGGELSESWAHSQVMSSLPSLSQRRHQ